MKVLLVGEYNRAHWNIKEGLKYHGHEAVTFGMQDGFKKVDVDIKIKNPFTRFLPSKLRILFYKLFKIDLLGIYVNHVIRSNKHELSHFDIVQFISESPFTINISSQKKALNKLVSWNTKAFVLSSGKDYPSISYAHDEKLRYSILSPFFENPDLKSNYRFALNYIEPKYIAYHDFVYSKVKGVIACDFDYHLPLKDHPKYLGLIPHAINLDTIEFNSQKINNEIVIFHGINKDNYYMKGNYLFEKALNVIEKKYASQVKIVSVTNLPYSEYIKAIESCHILLDQVYSYDLGFNALEAMAMGKVVFSGAEKEWQDHYKVKEDSVVINSLPNIDYLVAKLEWLINNPNEINKISVAARKHVEKFHDHKECANRYLKKWTLN
ncbi:glycosyltransferase [Winogradskyella sp. A3E31]|uniref:glycosyltransferase n=1 Tax=Winogradskyella sp. A3E31 TaxID=3349637 RepID=UPI00398ABDCE